MANRWGNNGNSDRLYFLGLKITVDCDCSHEIKRCLLPGRKAVTSLESTCIKKQRHHFADKGPYSQSYGFSSNQVRMWESDHKEGWVPKNWYFQTMVLEKTLESSFDSKEIKPVNPKGSQPWILIGRTDAEAEAPILWPPDAKSWLNWKRPWCWERLKTEEGAEDEMVKQHQRLNIHEFEQALGNSGGQ